MTPREYTFHLPPRPTVWAARRIEAAWRVALRGTAWTTPPPRAWNLRPRPVLWGLLPRETTFSVGPRPATWVPPGRPPTSMI